MLAAFNVSRDKKEEFNKEHRTSNLCAGQPRAAGLKAAV